MGATRVATVEGPSAPAQGERMSTADKTPPEIGDRLLRVREAASLLAISERQVWNLVESGALMAVHLGRTTRLRASDVRRLIESGLDLGEAGSRA